MSYENQTPRSRRVRARVVRVVRAARGVRAVGVARAACPATPEALESRWLLAATTGTLYGITGNQQSDNPAYIDETLYKINYALPGTGQGSPFLDGFEDITETDSTGTPQIGRASCRERV